MISNSGSFAFTSKVQERRACSSSDAADGTWTCYSSRILFD